ncbi:MAG: TonB-dependent receptor [Acidobacteria bacterium]|nr:TonB-dependent receptor [Acidobacteriota bacterium]
MQFTFSRRLSMQKLQALLHFTLLAFTCAAAQQTTHHGQIPVAPPRHSGTSLTVVVTDENNVVVPDALVGLTDNTQPEALQIHTDAAGRGFFYNLTSEHVYTLSIEKGNFYALTQPDVHITGAQTMELTLSHVQELKETVNVTASRQDIDPAQTANTRSLGTPEIINIPYPTSRDIRNLLTYLPQVVQDSTGQVHVAGAATYETTDVLDGFEITSPVSGIFAMRFSADAAREVSVQTSRVSTQFGKESGGIIDFSTGMGDDHFRFDATNFIPSWQHYRGLNFDKWVPRATFSGPIVKGKVWFFDSADAEYDSNIFKGLPPGNDRDPFLRGSNLAKVQINLRSTDILSFGLLNNTQDEDRQGLSITNPASATVKRDFSAYLADIKELHYFSGGALLETGFAWNGFNDRYSPQGGSPFVITPNTDQGNYFESFNGTSRRAQGIANLSLRPLGMKGRHEVRLGTEIDQINFTQLYNDQPFSLLRANGTLYRSSVLPAHTFLNRNNLETSGYIEDRWSPFNRMIIEPGVRFDWDEIVRRPLFSPRIAGTYMLGNTKLSAGIGVYYERTHLDYIGRALTGPRLDFYFDNSGTVQLGAPLVTNFFVNEALLHEPRFVNWSLAAEHRFPWQIFGGVEYLKKSGTQGFIFQNLNTSSILSGNYELTNTRVDHYQSMQFSVRKHFAGDYNLFVSYARSYAHSNAVIDYSLNNPIFSPQMGGPLPWDVPNRFLSWGWFPTPFRPLDFVYSVDYHSGFPWTAVSQNQQIVGAADSHRFPAYAALNPGLELRFTFRGYALALRGIAENVTDRKNPFFVVNNVDASNFGQFGGFSGRAFTARIRFLGRK